MASLAAAIFDFGGVLTEPIFRRSKSTDPAARLATFFVTEAIQVYAETTGVHDLHLLETGQLTEALFLRRLIERSTKAGNPPLTVEQARAALFRSSGLVACAAMVDAVREVQGAGYRTALLTNNVREWEDNWRGVVPVEELFDVVVDSSAVGMRKPDASIYVLTCERLGVRPEQCLFVDDLECNVDAARALGMEALHCSDPVSTAAQVLELLLPDQRWRAS